MADAPFPRLFDLLPQIYRVRDAQPAGGPGPLEALLDVVDTQVEVVSADIARLRDNFFIETCDEWVIPYIGDLVGTNLVAPVVLRARTDVAKTIHYRRRKGTVPMLEELARDVTGWSAKAVEFFQILGWTQNSNHVRLDHGGWFDVHDDTVCNAVGTAFDRAAHTVDVRMPAQAQGWHNIRNIGFFLWRLQAYSLVATDPRPEPGQPHRFHFSSLGQPEPLFIQPEVQGLSEQATDENDVRGPISPRWLRPVSLAIDHFDPPNADGSVAVYLTVADARIAQRFAPGLWLGLIDPADATKTVAAVLSEVRDQGRTLITRPDAALTSQTLLRGFPNLQTYYGQPRGFTVYADGVAITPLAPPPARRRVLTGDLCAWQDAARGTLVIDVRLGRFAFAPGEAPPGRITVDYNYGFSGDIGAGPYDRLLTDPPTIAVSKAGAVTTLQAALNTWAVAPPARAIIEFQDSATYIEALTPLAVPAGQTLQLTIRAADDERPTLLLGGDWEVTGAAPDSALALDGLLISGGGIDLQGTLGGLHLHNCTLDPGGGLASDGVTLRPQQRSLAVSAANTTLTVVIDRCIVGGLRVPNTVEELRISDSIVDVQGGEAISGLGGAGDFAARTVLRSVSILGRCWLQELTLGTEVIFADAVAVHRKQRGCVRFSYIVPGSDTPRTYECLPPPDATAAELARLVPSFTSTRYGDPGYVQLERFCPYEIATGASDGSEIGAFCSLKNPLRVQNLRLRLDEYLPFGLVPALIAVT